MKDVLFNAAIDQTKKSLNPPFVPIQRKGVRGDYTYDLDGQSRLMSMKAEYGDPIQPKVAKRLNTVPFYEDFVDCDERMESLFDEAVKYWGFNDNEATREHLFMLILNAHIKLISDLNKEILELRERVSKLENPEVTIHTPRFGTLQDATMPLKQPIDGVFLASQQLANHPKTL